MNKVIRKNTQFLTKSGFFLEQTKQSFFRESFVNTSNRQWYDGRVDLASASPSRALVTNRSYVMDVERNGNTVSLKMRFREK